MWDHLKAATLAMMPLIAGQNNSIASIVNNMALKLDFLNEQQHYFILSSAI
jgi:hypothetical protein